MVVRARELEPVVELAFDTGREVVSGVEFVFEVAGFGVPEEV